MKSQNDNATKKAGEIRADTLYTLDEFMDRFALGRAAIRKARREGLIVKKIGRRSYVLGSDVIEWYRQAAKRN